MSASQNVILSLIDQHHQRLLTGWLACLKRDTRRVDAQREAEITEQAKRFLEQLRRGAASGHPDDIGTADWVQMRDLLEDISRDRAVQGYSPSETANFVFALKEPLFELLRQEIASDAGLLAKETWAVSSLIDRLGLHTIECYARIREEVISRQQQELLELSTPVVRLWDNILALPFIGTLDSARTQIVMQSLLKRIVRRAPEIRHHRYYRRRPMVDTLVAQHLMKTVGPAHLWSPTACQRHPPADRRANRASGSI